MAACANNNILTEKMSNMEISFRIIRVTYDAKLLIIRLISKFSQVDFPIGRIILLSFSTRLANYAIESPAITHQTDLGLSIKFNSLIFSELILFSFSSKPDFLLDPRKSMPVESNKPKNMYEWHLCVF